MILIEGINCRESFFFYKYRDYKILNRNQLLNIYDFFIYLLYNYKYVEGVKELKKLSR